MNFYIFTRPARQWIFFGGKGKNVSLPHQKSVSAEEEDEAEEEEGGSAADDCMFALIYTVNASLLPGGNRPKARGSSG